MSLAAPISGENVTVKGNPSPWLNAWSDPLANLKTCGSCIRLGDVHGDNDSKLVVCDLNKKLKIYKGHALAFENSIPETPVALAITYSDNSFPRIPNIAVAAGPHIFFYRQLKPYRKWTCPPVDLAPEEDNIWQALKKNTLAELDAVEKLKEVRDNGVRLSGRSLRLISIETATEQLEFININKDEPYVAQTSITCMGEIKKDSEDDNAVNHLVVGTESNFLLILHQEPDKSNYLAKVALPSTPVLLCASGLLEIEWRIYVACRDGKIYVVKNGEVGRSAILTGTVMDLCSQAIAMTRQDKHLWVACMDNTVVCYTSRGKRKNSIQFKEDICDICVIAVKRARVSHLLLVALANGDILMFRESSIVYTFSVEAPVVALHYGSYGREDSSLIILHGKGAVSIKIWKRAVDADSLNSASGPPPEQDIPLPVPKKTKVYLENTQREKETATAMFKKFQEDLSRLRLEAMRAYVKTLTGGMANSSIGSADVKLQASVMGLGPQFILKLTLQNAGTQPLFQSILSLTFDITCYSIGSSKKSSGDVDRAMDNRQCVVLPVLLPAVKHITEIKFHCIDPQGRSGSIMVILKHGQGQSSFPILTASVKIPVSEIEA